MSKEIYFNPTWTMTDRVNEYKKAVRLEYEKRGYDVPEEYKDKNEKPKTFYQEHLEPYTIENFKKDNRLGDFFVSDSQKEIEKLKLEIKLTELKLELLKRGE